MIAVITKDFKEKKMVRGLSLGRLHKAVLNDLGELEDLTELYGDKDDII